jgi:hypothetical protein
MGAVVLTSADITAAQAYVPVNKAGDTMTGMLTLKGDASANLHAVTLQQLVAQIAAIPTVTGVTSWNGRGGAVTMIGTDVVSALGYTPQNVTGPFRPGDGTAAAPIYSFAAATNLGIYRDVTYVGGTGFAVGGAFQLSVGSFVGMISAQRLVWFNPGITGSDTGIGRPSAGLVEINNGTVGSYADLKLRALTATGQILAANGSQAAPGYSFASAPNTGLFLSGNINVSFANVTTTVFSASGIGLASDKLFYWYGPGFAAPDIGLARNGAGWLEINDGITPGNVRDLWCRNIDAGTGTVFSKGHTTPMYTAGSLTGTLALDYNNGQSQYAVITGNTTISAINNTHVGSIFRLALGATNAGTVTWPARIWWPGGVAPNLASGPNKYAVIVLLNIGGADLANYATY